MRGRARNLAMNNDYVRRYLRLLTTNIIGPDGVIFQSKVKDPNGAPDKGANKIIEDGWYDWARVVGFLEKQHLLIKTVGRDGEILVRLIRGKSAGNRYYFDIQLLESDHLDETYSDPAQNIVMGIQYNSDGSVKGYWIWEQHPGSELASLRQNRRIFIPASDMFLIYYRERPSQTRGFPWIHTALIRLNNISAYEEAEIYAARLGASKMGFITRDPDENSIGTGETDAGNPVISAEPGTFEFLNPGQDVKFFDPNHPAGNFDPFIKSQLRGAAAGLDVSYSSLSSDYSDANYSSLRQGALYERDNWMTLQSWIIRNFFEPVYREWLTMFLTSGVSNLPMSKIDKFNSPMFYGRRWKWVDPVKDISAMKMEVDLRIKSRTQICNENGVDFNDIVDELAQEEALLAQKGLSLSKPAPANNQNGEPV